MDRLIYILALVLGILYTVRKLEVQARTAPVPSEAFERWRALALRAYSWGSRASFLTILVRTLWMFVVAKTDVPRPVAALVGLSIDLGWLFAIGYSVYLNRTARGWLRQHVATEAAAEPGHAQGSD